MTRTSTPQISGSAKVARLLARVVRVREQLTASWGRLEWWRRASIFALAVLLSVEIADRLFPPPLAKGREVSAVVTDRHGVALRAFPVEAGRWRLKADVSAIDPGFVTALLTYEDKRFRSHAGVDVLALARAAGSWVSTGRIVSGGSTITMQTARLLEPHARTLRSKLFESIRAWQIERRLTKDEILGLYLTFAPYGGNIQGVRAASWAYFDKEPTALSPDQIALLIALPQSPEARRPDRHPHAAIAARRRVLERLAAEHVFASDLASESNQYPAPSRHRFPATAWHAAHEALTRVADWRSHARAEIVTTIDMSLQKQFEALAGRAAGSRADGVQVAMMAVDISRREIRAVVGSADRTRAGGWLDLTNRPRSPGSTLKPFIYGLAFDDGLAASGTRINDFPRRFATYRPEDFDRVFHGQVTVAEALQHSLNIPAVEALDAVGARRFAAALSFAGADLSLPLNARDDIGLPVALGGAGLTLRDLALLYAALGDGGRAVPLNWLATEADAAIAAPPHATQIMSAQSAGQIVQILAGGPAPAGRMPAALTREAPEIAFKTGTSYGYRDAWAAGIAAGYAVVVWTGRADGAPRPGITGRSGALPVLFDALDAIVRTIPARDNGVTSRSVGVETAPPAPLRLFEPNSTPPHILFPPDGAEVWTDDEHRDFVLAAEGRGALAWYVEGQPIGRNAAGDVVWRPQTPGFYVLSVVDAEGRTSKTRVRIKNGRTTG
jgi:penicillin-binding protein 1C